jgi:hypothetical protein
LLRLTIAEGGSSHSTRENAKTWARPFTARLLEPGIVSYEDRGCGIALLRKETIDRDIHSFIGRPITYATNDRGRPVHPREKTTPENMKAQSHGYVTEVYYNAADGWWYGRGVCDTDEAASAINRVGFCSVGYEVTRTGPGGVWHDIKYAEEILGFSGEHLAIVARPRYEEATIRLNAKNNKPNTIMFKFWKKSASSKPSEANAANAAAADSKAATTAATTVENASGVSEISPDSEIEVTDTEGKASKVTLGALIESHASVENAKKNGVDMDADDEIRHNGKTYKVNALIEAFDKWERKNASDAAEEEAKKRENASGKPEEEAKPATTAAAPATRENGKPDHFRVLLNASTRPAPEPARRDFNSLDERLARGARMFGSGK